MPFDAQLQARIDKLRGRGSDTEEDRLRAKLEKRSGQPGFAANTADIEAKLSEMGGETEETNDGE
jgi:hypothetical protein